VKEKNKPASVNYFAVVVLATNKTCGAFPWRVSVFSVLRGTTWFKNNFSSQCQSGLVSFFNQYSCIFSGILAG